MGEGKIQIGIEEALRDSEERFRTFIEQSVDGLVLVDENGIIREWNNANAKITGIPTEEIVGRPWMDAMVMMLKPERNTPESRTKLSEAVEHALRTGETPFVKQYVEVMARDGRTIIIQQSLFSIKTCTGWRIGSINRDVTDLARAEEALRASEEQFRAVSENAFNAVCIVNEAGKFVWVNEAMARLGGYSREQILKADSFAVFLAEESKESVLSNFMKFVRGEPYEGHYEFCVIRADGEKRTWEKFMSHITDRLGRRNLVINMMDITERKRMEEALRNTQRLESLAVLAGGIAHDFNNLLGGIFGYMDMAHDASTEEKVRTFLAKGVKSMNRARDLTRQLLTFAKGGEPVRKQAALFPFLQETVLFALSGSNITSCFDVAKDLSCCNYDSNQIGQVIDNLIINAKQAMPQGGQITVTASNVSFRDLEHPPLLPGQYVRLSVRDTGVGIPKELQARIFDPFFTTKEKGHGLGLAICYSIIKRHGGLIEVESEPGKGTAFHVFLPATGVTVSVETEKKRQYPAGNGTVIVMDDEEFMRVTIADMLQSLGYDPICFKNGENVVEYLKSGGKPAGMILDLTIPGAMGGREAIVEIRKLCPELPIYVSSGYAQDQVMMSPARSGFTASICKPFTKSELAELFARHASKT
jgi:PAS domain S-box-containing protein